MEIYRIPKNISLNTDLRNDFTVIVVCKLIKSVFHDLIAADLLLTFSTPAVFISVLNLLIKFFSASFKLWI